MTSKQKNAFKAVKSSDLPGRPFVRDFCGPHGAIDPKWVIRDASGEIIHLETWLCGQYISAMARGCLERNIRRVVFLQADESFAEGCSLAVIPDAGQPFRKLTGQELFALQAIKKLYGMRTRNRNTFTPDLSCDGAVIGDGFESPRPFPSREKARAVARTISHVYGLDATPVQAKGGWMVAVISKDSGLLDPETAIELRGVCKLLQKYDGAHGIEDVGQREGA